LIRDVERASLRQPDESVARAVEMWNVLRNRPDVRAVLESGRAFYELPFTVVQGGTTLRGRIDCVVRGSDGSLTILEFKTGRPDEVHERQLELYIRAVQSMCPGVQVRGRVVYL
jgi:RecB family exonuclease